MKKYFLFGILLPLFFTGYGQKISIGPEVGTNLIPLAGNEISQSYNLGFHFGANIKYNISKSFKLSSGIYFSQKKQDFSFSTTGSLNDLLNSVSDLGGILGIGGVNPLGLITTIPGINLNTIENTNGIVSSTFIEIPVLANYKFNNFNLYLGPYGSFLLSASTTESSVTEIPILDAIDVSTLGIDPTLLNFFLPNTDPVISKTNNTDGLTRLDIGANIGIGYEVNNLNFNLFYSQGFLDYRTNRSDADFSSYQNIRFSVAYLFDLKPKRAIKTENTPQIN